MGILDVFRKKVGIFDVFREKVGIFEVFPFAFGENIFCVLVPVKKLIIGSPVKLAVRKLVCGEGKMVCGESYPLSIALCQ